MIVGEILQATPGSMSLYLEKMRLVLNFAWNRPFDKGGWKEKVEGTRSWQVFDKNVCG
jgi:hypothetical protein